MLLRLICLCWLFLVAFACTVAAQDVRNPDQEQLLSWLPADTESVVAARGPFAIAAAWSEDEEKLGRSVPLKMVRAAFQQLPLELLYGEHPDVSKALRGETVLLSMQGSRHFRNPKGGLEVMDFEGCSITVFTNNVGTKLAAVMGRATRREGIAGVNVYVFHEKMYGAEWDRFVALPLPNLLLLASDRSYLQEVLERIAGKSGERALPATLPEWRYVMQGARYWGLRHYDRSQAKLDPTSPFGDVRAFTERDDKAIGFAFAVDPTDERSAIMTSISDDPSKSNAAQKGHKVASPEQGVRLEIRLQSPAAGVVQQVWKLNQGEALSYFILETMVALGRGMYI